MFAVRNKLEKGVTEMSCFNEEEQKKLMDAYSRKIKNTDLEIVENPEDLESRFSSDIITDAHSTVKPALGASKSGSSRSHWGTEREDDEFWM